MSSSFHHVELERRPTTQNIKHNLSFQEAVTLQYGPAKLVAMTVIIPQKADSPMEDSNSDSDWDSLFDEPMCSSLEIAKAPITLVRSMRLSRSNAKSPLLRLAVASRSVSCIPGLYFDPAIRLPSDFAHSLVERCLSTYFRNAAVNQIMLFERAQETSMSLMVSKRADDLGLPGFLQDTLEILGRLLLGTVPPQVHELLFPPVNTHAPARQAILNLYRPGEGISPHVDLLGRYADGIIGLSLGSGCVMRFQKAQGPVPIIQGGENACTGAEQTHSKSPSSYSQAEQDVRCARADSEVASTEPMAYHLYLPERSVIVFTQDARYRWTHAIEPVVEDLVQRSEDPLSEDVDIIQRDTRLSITFRWLLPGADVVGGEN